METSGVLLSMSFAISKPLICLRSVIGSIVYLCIAIHRFINISIPIYWCISMAMKKVMLAIPDEMFAVLEKERKARLLETVPETIRVILSDYLRSKASG